VRSVRTLNLDVSTFARIVGVSTIALDDDLAGIFVSRGTAILFDVEQLLIRTCDTFKTTKRLNRDSIRID